MIRRSSNPSFELNSRAETLVHARNEEKRNVFRFRRFRTFELLRFAT